MNDLHPLAQKLQRLLKTDIRYLAEGGFWLTSGNFTVSILSIVSAIAFANLLPAETYGYYKYVLSIAGLLSISQLLDLNRTITHAIARGNEGDFFSALKTKIKWSFFGSLTGLIISGFYFLQGNTVLSISILIISILLPIRNNFNIFYCLLNGRKLFKQSSIYKIIIQIIGTASIVITIYLTNNLLILLIVYLLVYALMQLLFFLITVKNFKPNKNKENGIITYGKHLSLINLIGGVISNLDNIILWHFLGAQQLAIYLFSKIPVDQIRSLLKFTAPVTIPKLANKTTAELKKILPNKAVRFSIIISFIVLIYILIAPFFYNILFPQYTESILYSQIIAFTLILFPKKLFGISLSLNKKKKEQFYTQTIVSIIRVVSFLILVPIFQIYGAIATLFISDFIHLLLLLFFTKKM